VYGNTVAQTHANGTVYMRPFFLNGYMDIDRINILQQFTSQSATTQSVSASVSAGNASSGTGSWGQTGTVALFSRVSTNETSPSFTNIVSFVSSTYSFGVGNSVSASWSTNASSATCSWTTSGALSYIQHIDGNGAITTASIGTSGSSTFSSTSTNANSFSASYSNSFGSQVLSGVRPIQMPFNTGALAPGEYWLMHVHSTNSGSTNYSQQRLCQQNAAGFVYYTTNTSGYAEIGNTATNATSNLKWGIGSYSNAAATTTTIGLTQMTAFSNASLYFILNGQTY
jgi:hypothetical protein